MNPVQRKTAHIWLVILLCFSCVQIGWFAAQVAENASAWQMVAFYGLMVAGLVIAIAVVRHNSPR